MATIIKRKKAYSLVHNYTNEPGETKQKWETWHTYKDVMKKKGRGGKRTAKVFSAPQAIANH